MASLPKGNHQQCTKACVQFGAPPIENDELLGAIYPKSAKCLFR